MRDLTGDLTGGLTGRLTAGLTAGLTGDLWSRTQNLLSPFLSHQQRRLDGAESAAVIVSPSARRLETFKSAAGSDSVKADNKNMKTSDQCRRPIDGVRESDEQTEPD